jgi:hypothetical protein
MADILTCDFQLNGTVESDKVLTGLVTIGQQQVPYDPTNGWQIVDGNVVRLTGTACDTLKSSAMPLGIDFPCGAVTFQ